MKNKIYFGISFTMVLITLFLTSFAAAEIPYTEEDLMKFSDDHNCRYYSYNQESIDEWNSCVNKFTSLLHPNTHLNTLGLKWIEASKATDTISNRDTSDYIGCLSDCDPYTHSGSRPQPASCKAVCIEDHYNTRNKDLDLAVIQENTIMDAFRGIKGMYSSLLYRDKEKRIYSFSNEEIENMLYLFHYNFGTCKVGITAQENKINLDNCALPFLNEIKKYPELSEVGIKFVNKYRNDIELDYVAEEKNRNCRKDCKIAEEFCEEKACVLSRFNYTVHMTFGGHYVQINF